MAYVFDSSALIHLFRNYYESRFPTLWSRFYGMVDGGQVISVREALNELTGSGQDDRLAGWAKAHRGIFLQPTDGENEHLRAIFEVPRFRALVSRKSLLKGAPVADPFLIAKAWAVGGCVVTTELQRTDACRIPNVCEHFGVGCASLERFMEQEGWEF